MSMEAELPAQADIDQKSADDDGLDEDGRAEMLEKESVSDLELNGHLEKVDAGKILMVIDACQSGQALGGKNDGKAPMNSKGFAQLAYDKGMYILTAAQSQQAKPRIV